MEEIKFTKWGAIHTSKTDEQLKQLAKDVVHGLVYTDKHLPQNMSIHSVFMVLLFLGGSQKKTSDSRQNKIYNILLEQEEAEYYKQKGMTKEDSLKEFYDSIGMVYEYMSEASPTAINGQPCFFSCQYLNKEETKRFFEFYEKYIELKKAMETEFGL